MKSLALLAGLVLLAPAPAQRRGNVPPPSPGAMLSEGTLSFDAPGFALKLVKSSQTVAALSPAGVASFDFTPGDMLVQRSQNGYYHLGDIDLRLRAAEIVVTGQGEHADALLAAARSRPALDRIVLHAPAAQALPPGHPARPKIEATTGAAAFVCIGETCSLPITDPAALNSAINAVRHT